MTSWDPPRTRSVASGEQSSADLNQKTHRTGRNDEGDRESAEPSLEANFREVGSGNHTGRKRHE